MRLLADKVPALEQYAHVVLRLEDVENEIVRLFDEAISNDERDILRRCRQLRNKLVHCDFHAARTKLHKLGVQPQHGGVRKVVFGDVTGADLVKHLHAGASGEPGSFEYFADTATTAAGGVFGWLLEMAASGDLVQAASVFARASGIIDRLAVVADEHPTRYRSDKQSLDE
jgi:hypothetical protein